MGVNNHRSYDTERKVINMYEVETSNSHSLDYSVEADMYEEELLEEILSCELAIQEMASRQSKLIEKYNALMKIKNPQVVDTMEVTKKSGILKKFIERIKGKNDRDK